MTGIPIEYLHKLVHYSTEIQGVDVKVKLLNVDYQSLTEKYINEMISALKSGPKFVGLDVKYLKRKTRSTTTNHGPVLVLFSGVNCLIPDLLSESKSGYNTSTVICPPLLREFLEDTSICFVGPTAKRPAILRPANTTSKVWGVQAGTLAAAVLKKPGLSTSSLGKITREVGVQYDGPDDGVSETIEVDMWDPTVLSEEQLKLVINNAYAYYKIGHKLLGSL